MGINKYNAEGYRDPTAYEAIKSAETFRITYPTGYLELNTESFFPCTVEKGRRVFRLIREYCTEKQCEELLAVLLRKERFFAAEAVQCDRHLDEEGLSAQECDETYARLVKVQRKLERIRKNIQQLKGGGTI